MGEEIDHKNTTRGIECEEEEHKWRVKNLRKMDYHGRKLYRRRCTKCLKEEIARDPPWANSKDGSKT